jgi:hypothetical protein
MNRNARRRDGQDFAKASPKVRGAVLDAVIALPAPGAGQGPPPTFYAKVRKLTIGAYYTTEAGFADIGYIGNQAQNDYPGASPAVKAALEKAYEVLGLGR